MAHVPDRQPRDKQHDPYLALRNRSFLFLLAGGFATRLAEQMFIVAVGYDLYVRTHSALALGYVGLALIFPVALFSLPAGHLADQRDRKSLVLASQALFALSALSLTAISLIHGSVVLYYVCLLGAGVAQAFSAPANTSLVADVVPAKDFSNAATWNSSTGQLASVLGPGVGGALLAVFHQGTPVYAVYVLASLIDFALLAFVRPPKRQIEQVREQTTFRSLFAGIRFLRQTPILLAAITLDLFAVLLGGATTLMPIYALDILRVGPVGLGVLQAMPSIGAVCMAVILAHLPPFRHAGRTLLVVVAGFGAATVVFGISRSFALSITMLIALGACDNISMVIRDTLMLTRTPNALMGRLSAIESIFVGTSNELGGFESGLSAQFLGPVVAVVAGGIGTILVVVAVAAVWPEMRLLGQLDPQAEQLATAQNPSEDVAVGGIDSPIVR